MGNSLTRGHSDLSVLWVVPRQSSIPVEFHPYAMARVQGGARDELKQCPQWAALEAVLRKLGIREPTPDLVIWSLGHRWDRKDCDVKAIYLGSREVVFGTLDYEIGKLNALQELTLSDTQLTGDLSALQSLTELVEINLRNTHMTGDLASLEGLAQLQKLNLGNTHVAGDLSSLQNLTQLKSLVLANTRVTGGLSSLQSLTQLQKISLADTRITGDLASLQNLNRLGSLSLSNAHVAGDLRRLRGLTRLSLLNLGNTHITGHLASLEGLRRVELLYLQNTNVAGDLASLQNFWRLLKLHLTNTQVTGSLGSLECSTFTLLGELHLSNTHVTGNLSSLQNLKRMFKLQLTNTSVAGDVTDLLRWKFVKEIDLEKTHVSGRLSSKWQGRWSRLRSLKLSHSRVEFLPKPDELVLLQRYFVKMTIGAMLPRLSVLELNGCPLDGDVQDLLVPLYGSQALGAIEAAGCGLSGALTLNLKLENVVVDGFMRPEWDLPLAQSLKVLNLADNDISDIEAVPEQMRVLVLAENSALHFASGVMQEALTAETVAGLFGIQEATELLKEGFLVKTDQISFMSPAGGYECHSIVSALLQVSPEKFLPDELCRCSAGFEGAGVQCHKCGQNTYSKGNGSRCTPCPEGSTAGEGEASCKCISGGKFSPDQSPACQCHRSHALNRSFDTEACVPCHKAHLTCLEEGMLLSSAPPEVGYARLRENDTVALSCLPPKNIRCNSTSNGSTLLGCASGYSGVLCSDCDAGHFQTKKGCKPCPTTDFSKQIWGTAAVAGGIGMLAVALVMCLRRMWGADSEMTAVPSRFSAVGAFKEQVKQLAPMLLQTCQLWAVLAALMKGESGPGSSGSWEIPYIEASQLSLDSLKGALNLQCAWHDAAAVRLASALIAPVAPIAVLLSCFALEIFCHGFGIAAALKGLTLFYVGGASGASKLLTCQRVDGDKASLPLKFEFRKAVPHLRCNDSSAYLDGVGYASIAFYGVVVPLCLAYLYARQHLAVLPGKAAVARTVEDGDQMKVRLVELNTVATSTQDPDPVDGEVHLRRLLAASAAHIAVKMRGHLRVTLKDGAVVATPSGPESSHRASEDSRGSRSSDTDWQLGNFSSLVEAKMGKTGITNRSRDLTESMLDRCLLEEAEASERALAGSKEILMKYSRCQNLYMEIIQKLVAVALVSVVNSDDGLQLSLAITLLMAATSGMVQPYFHPQAGQTNANVLQCCSFCCLALAAVGFSSELTWLSRGALVVPFLLTASLALRPDSTESLAVRLWRQMEQEIPKLQDAQLAELESWRW
eukprot:Skav229520  [mRNA]  locus=scaffold887:77290:86147:+ [translate_table: standard]